MGEIKLEIIKHHLICKQQWVPERVFFVRFDFVKLLGIIELYKCFIIPMSTQSPPTFNEVSQHIARDRVVDSMNNFGIIRWWVDNSEFTEVLSSKDVPLLTADFDKALNHLITTLWNISVDEFHKNYYKKLQQLIPLLKIDAKKYTDIISYRNNIITQYNNMIVTINQIKSDQWFIEYLTRQWFASLLRFETRTHKQWNRDIIEQSEEFIKQQYLPERETIIDTKLHKMLDKKNIAGIDIPMELLNLEDGRDCAMYLYTIMFNLVPWCNGKHPVIDTDKNRRLYYFDDPEWDDVFSGFHLTTRWVQLFEKLYNLAWYHITDNLDREPYVFRDTNDIYMLMRWIQFNSSDELDAANIVSVTRSLFHLIGHHPEDINFDHILSTDWKDGIDKVIDLSTLHNKQAEKRRDSDISRLNIQWSNTNGEQEQINNRTEFSRKYQYDAGMRYHPHIEIAWVKGTLIGRPKWSASQVTKLTNDPKYNHVDEMYDKIGNRIEIEHTGNTQWDRNNQLRVLYHLYTQLWDDVHEVKIKGNNFITFAKQQLDESNDNWYKIFLEKLLDKSPINNKTAENYEDCKLVTKQGTEYQIVRPWLYDDWLNNHSIYNVAKMVDIDLRVFGFVDMDWYMKYNISLLNQQFLNEIKLRTIKSAVTYESARALQTQRMLIWLQIARQLYTKINDTDKKNMKIWGDPMIYYIITQLWWDWDKYKNYPLERVYTNNNTSNQDDILTTVHDIVNQVDGFDRLYSILEQNPLKKGGGNDPLWWIKQYIGDQMMNLQSKNLDGLLTGNGGSLLKSYFINQWRRARLQDIMIQAYKIYSDK